jgi:HEAT repeat protein
MTTSRTLGKCAALAICFLLGISFAQNISQPRNGPPTTVAEKLRQHGVSLTRHGLVLALRSTDPETRFLAAAQLASERAKEAIPNMRDALKRENSPMAEINIGYALAQLEDWTGLETLKEACTSDSVAPHLRLLAAGYLLDLHRSCCNSSVLDLLQNVPEPVDRMQALSLLPRFAQLSESDALRMITLVLMALQDPTPAARISAGEVISRIGTKTDEQYVKAAIDREGDEVVRSQLQSDLQRLCQRYAEK